jgi:hypothetical protein
MPTWPSGAGAGGVGGAACAGAAVAAEGDAAGSRLVQPTLPAKINATQIARTTVASFVGRCAPSSSSDDSALQRLRKVYGFGSGACPGGSL